VKKNDEWVFLLVVERLGLEQTIRQLVVAILKRARFKAIDGIGGDGELRHGRKQNANADEIPNHSTTLSESKEGNTDHR
jgi:hypothetical protein